MTDLFVFRNTTVEPLFGSEGVRYSGYGDISDPGEEAAACVWAYTLPVGCDIGAQIREADSYIDRLRLVLDRIGPARMCYLFTLACPYVLPVESGSGALRAAVARYDAALYAFAAARPNVRVLDFASFLGRYACGERIDWRHWFLARTAVSPRLQSDFRHWFAAERRAALMQRRKCLVLDLDNTLWGGVLGEEGPEGIRIGGDYPGNAYLLFQQGIRELARTGVILTVCSKNNEADVLEVWERNPELLLRRGDFAARRINWRDKAGNIRELAAELNIGLDSMVFVDDNPAERELVRRMVPEVAVPDFPEQPYRLPEFLRELTDRYFRIYALTAEDRAKTEQYRANAARAEAARGYADFGGYLRSLGMVLTIRRADDFTRPRVAQMTQKTNQFNLTTRRYSEADIRRIEDGGGRVYTLSVRDRFGDSGITGCLIVADGTIDTLLLSCRILGRGIERAFLRTVLALLRREGVATLSACYLPTAKNGQTARFYDREGFTPVARGADGSVRYTLDLTAADTAVDACYTIECE